MSKDPVVFPLSKPSNDNTSAVPDSSSRRALFRRAGSVVSGVAVGAVVGAAGCGSTEPSAEGGAPAVSTGRRVRWRLASSFPRSLDTIFGGAEELAARVKAMTGGNFDIRVYPAGELVPGLQVMDAVQNATVQAGQTCSYYYIGKKPALAFDTCVPFGLSSRQQIAWLEQSGGRALIDGLFADFGIKTLISGNTGVQMGGWFKNEVPDLAGLSGLRMRIPGMGGKVMASLGVSVQNIAGGDIYPALERGAIDATEWVGPYDDEKLGFHKAAKNYYYPGWWEPGASMSIYVGKKAWDDLPAEYREILATAAAQAGLSMQAKYDALNPPALQRILAEGVTLRPFTDDVMMAAKAAAAQLLAEEAAADPEYAKVYREWTKFRDASFDWFGRAELAYGRFAYSKG
ncbi:MAG TPA: ABC transporter substrate-binding protein [Deltaproteobacteria bacterium]|nr:ABC transporter substrate-binding protein [Deltaproteobacteria bacterium]